MNPQNSSPIKKHTEEDEIDLGKLFERIGNFFLNALLTFVKNTKVFVVFILVGIILSIGFYFLQKPIYKSEMTISSRFLTNEFCAALISSLDKLVKEDNYNQLEHVLKIDKELVKDIKKIEFKNLNKKYQETDVDTIMLKTPFNIAVEVSDNNVLDTLAGSIAAYIANNKYAKRRERIEIDNLKNQIEMLAAERRSLDSLKHIATSSLAPRESKAGFVYGQPYEPLNIYKEEVNFFNRELDLRKKLVESESVEIIHEFTKFKTPKRAVGLIKSLFFGILISFILAVFYIAVKEINLALKRFEQRKLLSENV